jgi:hypothetical protein
VELKCWGATHVKSDARRQSCVQALAPVVVVWSRRHSIRISGTSSASTKRALVDGDSESFPLKRRRRAGLNKSAGDVAVDEGSLPSSNMARFPSKCRCCVNQKAERISKWEIFASANVRKFDVTLKRGPDGFFGSKMNGFYRL